MQCAFHPHVTRIGMDDSIFAIYLLQRVNTSIVFTTETRKLMYWNGGKRIQFSDYWNRLELSKSFYNDLLYSFSINKYRFWGIMSDSSLNWNSAKFDASKKWCRFPMKINSQQLVACKFFAYFQCCICLMYVQCTWKSRYQYCWLCNLVSLLKNECCNINHTFNVYCPG